MENIRMFLNFRKCCWYNNESYSMVCDIGLVAAILCRGYENASYGASERKFV